MEPSLALFHDPKFPFKIYRKTITLNADGGGANGAIVGSGAGSVGAGVDVIAAISGKTIIPLWALLDYTYATAAYTDGGTVQLYYGTSVASCSSGQAAAATFANNANNHATFIMQSTLTHNTPLPGQRIILKSTAAFTQPGTAAGTATLTVYYIVV